MADTERFNSDSQNEAIPLLSELTVQKLIELFQLFSDYQASIQVILKKPSTSGSKILVSPDEQSLIEKGNDLKYFLSQVISTSSPVLKELRTFLVDTNPGLLQEIEDIITEISPTVAPEPSDGIRHPERSTASGISVRVNEIIEDQS